MVHAYSLINLLYFIATNINVYIGVSLLSPENKGKGEAMIVKERMKSQILYTLVDEEADLVVGKATLTDVSESARLHTIYVDPKFRGRGYGERLMKEILEDLGHKLISLSTHYGGVRFFKKYNFEIKNGDLSNCSTLIDMIRQPSMT